MVQLISSRLIDCVTKWRRSDEEKFVLDPDHKPIVDYRAQLNEDLKIADGEFVEEELYEKIGNVDWNEIDKEIAEALEGSDDDSSSGDDEDEITEGDDWSDLDQEIDDALSSVDKQTILGKRKSSD